MPGAEKVVKMLEQSPLPDMVKALAMAIAEAQLEMDRIMVERLKVLADRGENGVEIPGARGKASMLDLGFAPTFYHFSEITINARVAFSSAESQDYTVGAKVGGTFKIFSASVNASYSNRYSFNADGASEITTKIISVPAPALLTERLSQLSASRRPT